MSASLLVLAPATPLATAVLLLAFGRRVPHASGWVATAASGIALVLLLAIGDDHVAVSRDWFGTADLRFTIGLRANGLTWYAGVLVASVSTLVLLYATAYLRPPQPAGEAPEAPRFFRWMSFFVGSMLVLVLADSFLLLFAAWEAVGVCSWALIGFHHREDRAVRAARKAFVVTRFADLGFFLAWVLALLAVRTTDVEPFLAASRAGGPGMAPAGLAVLFLIAALGKSAQGPFAGWLPDAMAGPTPVSALLHSATMVAAGAYLLLRLYPLFESAPGVLEATAWIGLATALAASLVATAQPDLKCILAWSTVAQLGEMLLAFGLGGPFAAAFHLGMHAAFKAGLFLVAGVVERRAGSRSLDALGGLRSTLPISAGAFAVFALALSGVPPFSGFFSEDAILGAAVATNATWGVAVLVLVALAGTYIGRAFAAVFLDWPGAPRPAAREPGPAWMAPIAFFAIGSVGLGFALKTPLEHLLPFEPGALPPFGWQVAAVGSSLAGLSFGIVGVLRRGPAPSFTGWPNALDHAANALVAWPAVATRDFASGLFPAERMLDRAARAIAGTVRRAASVVPPVEQALDDAARATAGAFSAVAHAVGDAETAGVSRGIDLGAGAIAQAGGTLRVLQPGKVWLYLLSVFAWVLAAGAVLLLVRL